MNKPTSNRLRAWAALAFLAGALPLAASQPPDGQWDFNGNLNATVGNPLTYADITTQNGTTFNTTTAFGISNVGGTAASVMNFPASGAGGGYKMPIGVAANGGGTFVNDYTVIMDVLYPAISDGHQRALLEADLGAISASGGAEFYINSNNQVGSASGSFFGTIATNTWYRIGLVVQGSANTASIYIDGVQQGSFAVGGIDGRYALNPSSSTTPYALLFQDNNGANTNGYVSSVQFRAVALSPGQMQALGSAAATKIPQVIPPVPPYFRTRTPGPNATGVAPNPTISAVLDQGDRTITPGTVNLLLDGTQVAATITPSAPTYTINYAVPGLLSPQSTHTVAVSFTDNTGAQTLSWSFTVAKYQSVTLPTPIYLENFESLSQGTLPAGWSVTNLTDHVTAGTNYFDLTSDAYLNWAIIPTSTASNWLSGDYTLRLSLPPIVVNGQLLPALMNGNFAYAESDQRDNNQVQVMFTKDFDLTGEQNVFLSFYSAYEQNQDSMGAVEYSVDQGATWLPIVYMLDDQDKTADVIYSDPAKTQIDAVATMTTARDDQAYGQPYGTYIGAPISQALAPYISGRINDDTLESKRVELYRIPAADNAAHVRFRFTQTGTASWFWGIDNVGLYSINTPVITQGPAAQTVSAGDDVTFTVTATINPPYTYQWYHNNNPIQNSDTDTLVLHAVDTVDAGEYKVTVSNSDGPTTSQAAVLTVITSPQITAQPLSLLVSAGAPGSLSVAALGRKPFTYQWYQGTTPVGANSGTLSFASAAPGNSGDYKVTIANSDGNVTSVVATVTVFSGTITQDLVTHLTFDGDLNDTSGKSHNGTAVGNIPFGTGQIGQGAGFSTTVANGRNYITLGAPTDLNFGTGDFTISFWIKYTERHSDPSVIANKDWGSGGNQGWVFAPSGTGLKWNVADSTRTRKDSPGLGTLNDGKWHHYITTFHRADRATTFIDGVQVNTVDISSMTQTVDTPTGLAVNIGEDGTGLYNDVTSGDPGFADAMIDDLGIWRRALTPQEAIAVAAFGKQGKDLTQAIAVIPTLGMITFTPNGSGGLNFNWTTSTGVRLQSTTSLTTPSWQDVPNTTGTGSITIPIGTGNEFFRLFQP